MTIKIQRNEAGRYIATINGVHGSVEQDVSAQIGQLVSNEAYKLAEELAKRETTVEHARLRAAVEACKAALREFIEEDL